eukprot:Gb_25384 [translate_table: standard]
MTSSSRTVSPAPTSTLTLVSDPEASRTALSTTVFQSLFVRQAPDAGSTLSPSVGIPPLLESHQDILQGPTGLPPSRASQRTIDLIPGSSSPTGPVSKTSASETVTLQRHITVLFKEGNLQPSTSPCNQVHVIHRLPDDICTAPAPCLSNLQSPFQAEPNASQLAMGVVPKQGGHPVLYYSETFSQSRIHEHRHI